MKIKIDPVIPWWWWLFRPRKIWENREFCKELEEIINNLANGDDLLVMAAVKFLEDLNDENNN